MLLGEARPAEGQAKKSSAMTGLHPRSTHETKHSCKAADANENKRGNLGLQNEETDHEGQCVGDQAVVGCFENRDAHGEKNAQRHRPETAFKSDPPWGVTPAIPVGRGNQHDHSGWQKDRDLR